MQPHGVTPSTRTDSATRDRVDTLAARGRALLAQLGKVEAELGAVILAELAAT